MKLLKLLFYISNLILFIFYLYPGDWLACKFYSDCSADPPLIENSYFSLNHIFAFTFLSLLAILSYKNKFKKIFIYLLFISIILELTHTILPNRSFQVGDLLANTLGVLLVVVIFKILNLRKKNELI